MTRTLETYDVPGGMILHADLFDPFDAAAICDIIRDTGLASLAIADPPYGGAIVSSAWDSIGGEDLADELTGLARELATAMLSGSHLCIWGGIGSPGDRAFYRMIPSIEEDTDWKMAEHITWEKKRGYGIQWRCLFAREECARFVLGDIRKPRVFNVQHTNVPQTLQMGKTATRKPFKRLTSIWHHATDMGKKLHECYKPPPLARTLIDMCSDPEDVVLDLFAGSGEVSYQARESGRLFLAVENDPGELERLWGRLKYA